jgi:hypothetical protein
MNSKAGKIIREFKFSKENVGYKVGYELSLLPIE